MWSSFEQKAVPVEAELYGIFFWWAINQDYSPTNLKAIKEIMLSKKNFIMRPRIGRGKCSLNEQGQSNLFTKNVILILPGA